MKFLALNGQVSQNPEDNERGRATPTRRDNRRAFITHRINAPGAAWDVGQWEVRRRQLGVPLYLLDHRTSPWATPMAA
jgi:hypothetical protein